MFGIPWASLPFSGSPTVAYPSAGASEHVLFMTGEISDGATFEAGATAQMDVENLQDQQPGKKWRSTATTDYIDITLAEPLAANGLMLNATNLGDAGWLRAVGFRSAADRTAETDSVVDSNWQSAWPLGFRPKLRNWPRWINMLRWSNDVQLLHWRIYLSDPSASGGYLEAGRLVLDRYSQPVINCDHGPALGQDSYDVQERSPWGGMHTEVRRSGRFLELRFSNATWRNVFDLFSELQRLRGLGKDVVVVLDPAATAEFQRFAIHGLITAMSKLEEVALKVVASEGEALTTWSFSITVSELLD